MTVAICMICGGEKTGSLLACSCCGFRPETGFELSLSLRYSDRNADPQRLSQLSCQLASLYKLREPFELEDATIVGIIDSNFDPRWRDVLTLRRSARDTFITKRVDAHFLTPDGYEHQVLPFKRGRALRELRQSGCNDLFFVTIHENGTQHSKQMSRASWYALHDHGILMSRSDTNATVSKASEYSGRIIASVLEKETGSGATDFGTSWARTSPEHMRAVRHPEESKAAVCSQVTCVAEWAALWSQIEAYLTLCPPEVRTLIASFAVTSFCASGRGQFRLTELLPSPLNLISSLSNDDLNELEAKLWASTIEKRNTEELLRTAIGSDLARLFVASARSVLQGRSDLAVVYGEVERLISSAAQQMASNRKANVSRT